MSSEVVVDASLVIKWVIHEEDSDKALSLLADWTAKNVVIYVPALLAYEVTNLLYRRARRDEIDLPKAKEIFSRLMTSELSLYFSQEASLGLQALELAHQFGLPATYDAHYLALAHSKKCDLWTADARLWATIQGQVAWVRWLGDYQL
ncbi:MAG: type II toxin-antitoxin system VapC family toxin [Chloroflexi bacterium]|nr:type II toxin-antitoxin system VapC family toxin [Ktedonobacteraceae bacterium]MBV8822177.1 type II toxin-antitoxin system VapC family toxin [Ktedonobacteraceae bacterium]MBV9021479.1 type II toxin-antitoxin system VapC family toxin [Ktedonobacteraceae bacterium]MBV9708976.1 type II toxin-antitoxin system VapC family toxin [Chloroflexota bacterium]